MRPRAFKLQVQRTMYNASGGALSRTAIICYPTIVTCAAVCPPNEHAPTYTLYRSRTGSPVLNLRGSPGSLHFSLFKKVFNLYPESRRAADLRETNPQAAQLIIVRTGFSSRVPVATTSELQLMCGFSAATLSTENVVST